MREWTDENTGRPVRQLTAFPKGAALGYFRFPKRLPDGRLVIHAEGGIVALDPQEGDLEPLPLVPGRTIRLRESDGRIWHTDGKDRTVWATDLPHGRAERAGQVPDDAPGWLADVTCDGRTALLLDTTQDLTHPIPAGRDAPALWRFLRRPRSSRLHACDLRRGTLTTIARSEGVAIDHVDASPADPGLVRFCHDGISPADQRIWAVRTDGSGLRAIRPQRAGETIVHEFWWPDGKLIGYKLQDRAGDPTFEDVPWGEYAARPTLFGLADLDGREVYLSRPLNHWHSHIHVSPDARRLCGEGTDGHSFVYAAPFSMSEPAVDFAPLATVHTPYVPFRGQRVDAAFSADSRRLLYNDTVAGVLQVCAVPVEL